MKVGILKSKPTVLVVKQRDVYCCIQITVTDVRHDTKNIDFIGKFFYNNIKVNDFQISQLNYKQFILSAIGFIIFTQLKFSSPNINHIILNLGSDFIYNTFIF